MGLANVALGVLATLTIATGFRRFGWNSFVGLGLIGAAIYSLPAFLGFYAPIQITLGERGVFAATSLTSVIVVAMVWSIFLFLVSVLSVPPFPSGGQVGNGSVHLLSCAVLVLFGYGLIALSQGPIYFLQARHDISYGATATLWRWLPAFGIMISVFHARRIYLAFFLFFLAIHFTSGDRTIPAITTAACVLIFFMRRMQRMPLPKIVTSVLVLFIFFLMVFGKPVYLVLKDPSLAAIQSMFSWNGLLLTLKGFEPLGTYSLLEFALDGRLNADLPMFLLSIIGNILIVPSAFGVDTNYFNTFMTNEMPSGITFGLAGNYFASGYVGLGYFGVIALAVFFILALRGIEKYALRTSGLTKLTLTLIGATMAIYAHRNGIDNLFSFIRQIVIVGLAIGCVSVAFGAILPMKPAASGPLPR